MRICPINAEMAGVLHIKQFYKQNTAKQTAILVSSVESQVDG